MSILTESLMTKIKSVGSTHDLKGGVPQDGLSYVQGRSDSELRYITISEMFRETVSRYGPREALVFKETDQRFSYYDFDREIDALASGLLAMGLEKGDTIGIWSPNRFEWVLTQFATARIGVVMVNINPAYRVAELEYALNKVGCKALILAKSFKSSNYLDMIRQLAPELKNCEPGRLRSARLPQLQSVVVMDEEEAEGVFSFDQVKNLGGPAQQLRLSKIEKTLTPDDPINVQFTSGTTGAPKGATLSHYNIVNNARFVTYRIELSEADRLCIPVPLYHCFGMVMGVLGAVSKGATMIFPGEAFEPKSTLEALSSERCTAVYGVPTMFVAMLQEMESQTFNLGSLRTGIMAGAPCPIEIMEKVGSQMHMKEVTICYGMTETSPVSFQSFVDDPVEKRCATVGRIHPHLEVKIVDDNGQIVPVGEQGELCTRGYSVMKGYWEDTARTDEAITDGWMHTGDLAVLDAEGFCSIVGRKKDMIIRGGENIYPREIEEYLFRHPDIIDVQVFGIPDDRLGEEVCTWIVAKNSTDLDAENVKSFCQGQIAHYKIPKHIRIVEEIPMTITGKPQKFVMQEQMSEFLGK